VTATQLVHKEIRKLIHMNQAVKSKFDLIALYDEQI